MGKHLSSTRVVTMKRLIAFALYFNSWMLGLRVLQELPARAQEGEPDPALYGRDFNGDGSIDISDPIYFVNWWFSGQEPPQI